MELRLRRCRGGRLTARVVGTSAVCQSARRGRAIDVANAYRRSTCRWVVSEPERALDRIRNAGAQVFLGRNGAGSYGDYLAGGRPRAADRWRRAELGSVTTASFMKSFTIQQIDAEGVRRDCATCGRLRAWRLRHCAHGGGTGRAGRRNWESRLFAAAAQLVRETRGRQCRSWSISTAARRHRSGPVSDFTTICSRQVAQHGGIALSLSKVQGDLEIDAHHTIEDCARHWGRR